MVDDFGGTRSDPGMLGAGIYFAGSSRYVGGREGGGREGGGGGREGEGGRE